eukprot:gnl/MRDRNA2_/MRDRNA2_33417_c0_seq1.p1 gnl/MRDRNA2_/MRDRNA2_33417_c0~~gnl/MRDRNA2_/MRDRNA2_33417_c0_seq1.p1  ORF type:complete len:154 (+),score=34.46 gnl/MRDRNA2_/MRDRNA2_33417_c0_seq1:78-539(+)
MASRGSRLALASPTPDPAANCARRMNSENPGLRARAVWSLGDRGMEAAPYAQRVSELLDDGDPRVRAGAARCLGCVGVTGAEYAAMLARLCRDDEIAVRNEAMKALKQIHLYAPDAVRPYLPRRSGCSGIQPFAEWLSDRQRAGFYTEVPEDD